MYKILPLCLFAGLFVYCNHGATKVPAPEPVVTEFGNVHPDFSKYCSECHGAHAETFIRREWKNGNSRLDIMRGIREGYPEAGMPPMSDKLSEKQIFDIADYIIQTMEKQRDKAAVANAPKENKFISEGMKFHLDTVLSNLDSPWGITFLPNGDMIFTEKEGSIWRYDTKGQKTEITGAPKVMSGGQGGLLDVELHPRFSENKLIYFTYSKPKTEGSVTLSTTAVFRARLEGNALMDGRDIFVAEPYAGTQHHFGSRMEFGRDGYLYVSVGERGKENEFPQSLQKGNGKIHRITDEGGIPQDNPFYNTPGAVQSIWSYGHRNPQGLAFDPVTGELWEHEHGPRGGDELNLIQPGKNYGWPVTSYGTHYDGSSFTERTTMDGIEAPVNYWVPSIAPCGMAFITGNRYPAWKGDILIGSLRFRYLNRCHLQDHRVVKQENLFEDIGRVRAIAMSTDGYIYFSVEKPGYIFRIKPDK